MSLWSHWVLMCGVMVLPVAVVLAVGPGVSARGTVSQVAGFLAVWLVAGVPGAFAIAAFSGGGNVLHAAVLACAGGYQFSRRHEVAVAGCISSPRSGIQAGVRQGWHCLVACGPLMVATMLAGLTSLVAMVLLGAVMAMEFARPRQRAWSIGLGAAMAVTAAAILFLGYEPSFVAPLIGDHHHVM